MCFLLIIFVYRRIKRVGIVKVGVFLKTIEQTSDFSSRGQYVCLIREELTLIFNHRLMLSKYSSDDEGDGVAMTLSQTIVGSVERKWRGTVCSTTVCLAWPSVFSCARLDGRPDICRANYSSTSPFFSPTPATGMDFQ